MYDRFDDRARRVLTIARQEAQRYHHDHIGTEHLLLGVAHPDTGVAASLLERRGVPLERIRGAVERRVAVGGTTVAAGRLPFTPHAKEALEASVAEARRLGHTSLGTEHLLLGLLHAREGVAADVLRDLDVETYDLRAELLARGTSSPSS
jgi:ATP-dependent Clp protease ATP-binding subunit ClpC